VARDWEPGMGKRKRPYREAPVSPVVVEHGQQNQQREISPEKNAHWTVCERLEYMAGLADEGYAKFCPGNDGKSWYVTWTWTRGQWAGHYIMCVVHRYDLDKAVSILNHKFSEVLAGRFLPTKDNAYHGGSKFR